MNIRLFYGVCLILGLAFTLLSFLLAGLRPVRLRPAKRRSRGVTRVVELLGRPFVSLFPTVFCFFVLGVAGTFCLKVLKARGWPCHAAAGLSALAAAHLARFVEGYVTRTTSEGSDLKPNFSYGHLAVTVTDITGAAA